VKDKEKTTRDKRVEEHNAAIQQRARMEKQGRNPKTKTLPSSEAGQGFPIFDV
tara:strand:- start:126 stop:284 length:159 start_codon:yes stop_codon:yes gene_type:complete